MTGNEIIKQSHARFQPILQVRLHGIAFHALQTQELCFLLGLCLRLEFLHVFHGFFVAPGTIQSTQRGLSSLFNVLHHVLVLGTELVAHGLARLLFIRSTVWASLLVEVPNGGPPSSTWIVRITSDGCFAQIDIRKTDIVVPRKGLRGVVP